MDPKSDLTSGERSSREVRRERVPRGELELAIGSIELSHAYELGVPLGRGGMAEVFAATERETGRQLALKRIIPNLVAHPRMRKRFANEVDLLGRCRGPCVLELEVSGWWDDVPAYVSELCTGSLFDLARERPMPLPKVLRFTSEVLVALDRVHAQGGVHRDIKPSNILIGSDGVARLADFGIARHPLHRVTAVGHRVGTPAFAAPDLTADPRMADPTHDLFSVGLLILALSTHMRSRALTEEEQRATTLRLFPAAAAELLARSTSPDPSERYASAAEMAVAVQKAMDETHQ